MATSVARHAVLSDTATFDDDDNLRVVIETPKSSRAKFAYDRNCDCFGLKTVLPQGMTFPYDFGFIPSTLGDDGDPVDILVLMDFPVFPGCTLTARLIGVIEAKQKEGGAKWIRNDRLIAVATHARTHAAVRTLKDLRPHLLDEIKAFFVEYNKEDGKKFKPIADHGPDSAMKLVHAGQKRFARRRRKKK